MNITPHFTLEEATRSSTGQRLGINNTPDASQLAGIYVSAAGMEQVRQILGFPVFIDSWLRVEELEKVLTRKDFLGWCKRHQHPDNDHSWALYFALKAHPKGFGVDFLCPQFGSPKMIVKKLLAAGLKFDKLIMEGGWVHVSFAPAMRGEYLIATFTDGEPSYTKGPA